MRLLSFYTTGDASNHRIHPNLTMHSSKTVSLWFWRQYSTKYCSSTHFSLRETIWGWGWGWDKASTIAISSRLRESSGGLNLDQLLPYDHEDQAQESQSISCTVVDDSSNWGLSMVCYRIITDWRSHLNEQFPFLRWSKSFLSYVIGSWLVSTKIHRPKLSRELVDTESFN